MNLLVLLPPAKTKNLFLSSAQRSGKITLPTAQRVIKREFCNRIHLSLVATTQPELLVVVHNG